MTIQESLSSIVNYPIPGLVIENIASSRSLEIEAIITDEIRASNNYRLAVADILWWTSLAPNVQQGGVNYSILYSDRKEYRETANLTYKELGDRKYQSGIRQTFSYQGDDI